MTQLTGATRSTSHKPIHHTNPSNPETNNVPSAFESNPPAQAMRTPRHPASSISQANFASASVDKKQIVDAVRAQIQSDGLTKAFVESNAKAFRALSGKQRKQLADIAVKIDLPTIRAQDDPVTQFFLKNVRTLSAGESKDINVGPLHFETEEMALDFEHCGVLEIGRYDFTSVSLHFECEKVTGLFRAREGTGTVTANGQYQRWIKCYKDFKETSEVGKPKTQEKYIFRGDPAKATFTPKEIKYIVGEKKRSLKWGAPRINLYKVETGNVRMTANFTHKHHPDNDKGGTVS